MNDEQSAAGAAPPASGSANAEIDAERPSALADEIMADPDGAYWNSGHRDHHTAVQRVAELLTAAHGDDAAIMADGTSAAFHGDLESSLAAPEDPAQYDFNVLLDEGQEYDTELDQAARGWFHMAGVPDAEAPALVQRYRETAAMSDEEVENMGQQTGDFLSKVWGAAYDDNLNAARNVARSLGTDFTQLLDDTGLGNDRTVIQTLYRISQQRR